MGPVGCDHPTVSLLHFGDNNRIPAAGNKKWGLIVSFFFHRNNRDMAAAARKGLYCTCEGAGH